MTQLRLDGIEAKLRRAEKQIAEMGTTLDRWAAQNPGRLSYSHYPMTGLHEWRFSVDTEPPEDAGHALVEAIYHLRAALDQLVNRAAEAAGNAPNEGDRLQFPICGTRKSFKKTAPSAMRGVPASAVFVIESFQPFHVGTDVGERLRVLHRLSNVDKHRDVHPHAVLNSQPLAADAQVRAVDAVRSIRTDVFGSIGQPATDIPMISAVTDPPYTRVELVQMRIPKVAVVFGEGNARVMIADLRLLSSIVRDIVEQVAAAVDGGS